MSIFGKFFGNNSSAEFDSKNLPQCDETAKVVSSVASVSADKLKEKKLGEIEIHYTNSKSGAGTCFILKNFWTYFPSAEGFSDLMNPEEKELSDLIWFLSLFNKFGMLPTKPALFNGVGLWTSHYDFEIDGIPGILVYDDEYEMISNFSVDPEYSDKRKVLAESLRDLIVSEGKKVSYNDWLVLKKETERR